MTSTCNFDSQPTFQQVACMQRSRAAMARPPSTSAVRCGSSGIAAAGSFACFIQLDEGSVFVRWCSATMGARYWFMVKGIIRGTRSLWLSRFLFPLLRQSLRPVTGRSLPVCNCHSCMIQRIAG